MQPFPEAHELISFFSQEPELLDADAGILQHPQFQRTRRRGRLRRQDFPVRSPATGTDAVGADERRSCGHSGPWPHRTQRAYGIAHDGDVFA